MQTKTNQIRTACSTVLTAWKLPRALKTAQGNPLTPSLFVSANPGVTRGARGGALPAEDRGSDAVSREEGSTSLRGPEPASDRLQCLRRLALPLHGAAPGAAARRERPLGDAGAARHRRLRERQSLPAPGEAWGGSSGAGSVWASLEHGLSVKVGGVGWGLGQ